MSLSSDGVWKAGVWATTVWTSGVWYESGVSPVVVVSGGAGGNFQALTPKRKRGRVIRWSDLASQEERQVALAQALADASITLKSFDEDAEAREIEEEDELIISMVLSRIVH